MTSVRRRPDVPSVPKRDDALMVDGEELLAGSGDHHGEIRRVGETVVRPLGAHSDAVHKFLRHLEAVGFDGAPRLVRATSTEEVLTFVPGEVPTPPEPPSDGWRVTSDERASSVATLLARFHDAARAFAASPDLRWRGGFTPGLEHAVVCHNDPVVGNVVFRDEDAVALLDFDFAGPNDPLRDLAIAVQHWVPLGDPVDVLAPVGWSPEPRLRAMCDAYGLPAPHAPRLIDLVDDYLDRGRQGVETRVRAGDARFVAYWQAGLGDRLQRALRWLRTQRDALVNAAT